MSLTRRQIVDAAMDILRNYGLGDLSMRRLARDLGVQPGALYWHVKNKQDLLGVLAEQILAQVDADAVDAASADGDPVRRLAADIRAALLAVRDGADVVSLAHALNPEALPAIATLRTLLQGAGLTDQQTRWGARTLTHFILGAVAEEQTHADLAAAGLLPENVYQDNDDDEAFLFGVDAVLAGLRAR